MPVPLVYRKGSDVLTTYNFSEMSSGQGIVSFYGIKYMSGAALIPNALYSDDIYTDATIATSTPGFAKDVDLDFDLSINVPTVVKGILIANIPLSVAGTAHNVEGYMVLRLRKVSNGVETEVALACSDQIHKGTTEVFDRPKIMLIQMDVPQTNYKKGDTLRFTVEAWGSYGVAGDSIAIGHDPKGRLHATSYFATAGDITTMIVNIPIMLQQ